MTDDSWIGAKIISANYNCQNWHCYPTRPRRISFFWNGVLSCLPPLRCCICPEISNGENTLFWKDRWIDGIAPMSLWTMEFRNSLLPNGTIKDLAHCLEAPPFRACAAVSTVREKLNAASVEIRDNKRWMLTGNGIFTVKTFYNFLIDGGLRCPVANFFWSNRCPKKINLLNWLVWKNKVLTLVNLARRRCNLLPTDTCVMCHSASESADHLFLLCPFARSIWNHFILLLNLRNPPLSLDTLWGKWRREIPPSKKPTVDLIAKAIIWTIWTARNDCVFNANVLHVNSAIMKVDRLFISWCSSVSDGSRDKLEETVSAVKRSLAFTGPQMGDLPDTLHPEEILDHAAR